MVIISYQWAMKDTHNPGTQLIKIYIYAWTYATVFAMTFFSPKGWSCTAGYHFNDQNGLVY